MSVVHAPYGFVPVSEAVFLPPWQGAVSQDLPFEDGISGILDLKITAETPIFVRGNSADEFFKTPDGQFAIPGSTVRGTVRNVLEIATFGWISSVNDHRYGVRDLHNQDLYGRHMASIMPGPDGKSIPMPKVIAGWLQLAGNGEENHAATITPCHFAKIEYRYLMAIAKERNVVGFSPGEKQSAVDKYNKWGKASRSVKVQVENLRPRDAVGLPYDFGRVVGAGSIEADIIFTGQPSRWTADRAARPGGGQPKHHDFVFYGKGEPIPVGGKVFEGFEFVHSDRGQQNARNRSKLRNEEWRYWGTRYDRGERVPVFFLLNEAGNLRAFGLAMMFRLAYDNSVMDAVRNAQPTMRLGNHILDFAQTLFGNAADDSADSTGKSREGRSLKGRVSFSLARSEGKPQPGAAVQAVLGTPKASYYPAYVEQMVSEPGSNPPRDNGKVRWQTWMDKTVRIRGWKRYRPQPGTVTPPSPARGGGQPMDVSRVASRFKPLPAGTTFRLRVRLHNVRLEELGALLWAVDFGGDGEARHTVGMGRSLGYGRCRLELVDFELEDVREIRVIDIGRARTQFEKLMEDFAKASNVPGGWAHSRQLFELQTLAHPLDADSPHRNHMRIDDPVARNEFQNAKTKGQALPSAGVSSVWRQQAAAAGHPVAIPVSTSQNSRTPEDRPSSSLATVRPREHTGPTVSAGIKGGTRVEVELTGQNKKGKWNAKILNPPAVGVISFGVAPPDAATGKRFTVTVTAGGDLKNVQMKWE